MFCVYAKLNNHNFRSGVILGDPTGLTAKLWTDDDHAFDFGFAWAKGNRYYNGENHDWEHHTSIYANVDYLWHFRDVFNDANVPLYIGVGWQLRTNQNANAQFGVRIPFGIAYEFPRAPIEIFAEIAPAVILVPSSEFDTNGGIGARFYFR